jgi:hypothetical protein
MPTLSWQHVPTCSPNIDGSFGSAPGYQRLITPIFVDIVLAMD